MRQGCRGLGLHALKLARGHVEGRARVALGEMCKNLELNWKSSLQLAVAIDNVIMNLLSYWRMEKKVIQLPDVIAFARGMSVASQKQYYAALDVLEGNGRLSAPRAEKVDGVDNVFAIRILTRGNERFSIVTKTRTRYMFFMGMRRSGTRFLVRS